MLITLDFFIDTHANCVHDELMTDYIFGYALTCLTFKC